MTPGQIITVFTDPINQRLPEGQAVLIEKKNDFTSAEIWTLTFLDDPNEFKYSRMIKKENLPINTKCVV